MKILDVNEVQGQFIRNLLRLSKDVTIGMYRDAHYRFMPTIPNRAIHDSIYTLVMEVNHERWNPECPECGTGVSTGRLWDEARCFGCGAVFRRVVWPEHIDAIEKVLLKRPPKFRHWKPEETVSQLLAQNVQHGFADVHRPELIAGLPLRQLKA